MRMPVVVCLSVLVLYQTDDLSRVYPASHSMVAGIGSLIRMGRRGWKDFLLLKCKNHLLNSEKAA